MMDNVLSLQLLNTVEPVDTACSQSSVSCPSQASCQSHTSSVKATDTNISSW